MKRIYAGVISLFVVLLFCSGVLAVPTLDQYQDNMDDYFTFPFNEFTMMAQTFTAGLTGLLDHLEIGCVATSPTMWEIRETTAGVPSSTVLGGTLISHTLPSGWNDIDLASEGIIVNAGTMYSIVTYHSEGVFQAAFMQNGNPYTAGQLLHGGGSVWLPMPGSEILDMQFRTYVDTSIIPAPGAVILVSIGAGLVGWMRRRRSL